MSSLRTLWQATLGHTHPLLARRGTRMAAMGVVRACAPPAAVGASSAAPSSSRRDAAQTKRSSRTARVLVLGGTGRVGGSTATALSKLRPDLSILVGGRNRSSSCKAPKNHSLNPDVCLFALSSLCLVLLDDNHNYLDFFSSFFSQGVDLVIHTAGPFQRAEECTVLQALSNRSGYLEEAEYLILLVIINILYSSLMTVMAAELVHAARSENGEPERLRFFYYTAGTGGAGPTILATSFLLLGEDVIAYNKGEEIKLKPYSGALGIDFGKGVRKKNVYLLCATVSAQFGTAPFFWNWGMQAFANFLPAEFLRDRNKVQKLVESVDPLVRAIDGIAGERVSIRVDLECSNGRNTIGLFTHRKQSVSVGFATAAFALAVLEGNTQPGVWFPEEEYKVNVGMIVRACMPLPSPPVGEAAAKMKKGLRSPRVLVLGGTGRVGWSTATALSKFRPDLNILIGGRNQEKGKSLASKLGKRSEFVQVDIHDASMLEEALYGVDLVVHAAGPFQREDKCTVLRRQYLPSVEECLRSQVSVITNLGEEIKLKPYSGVLNIDFGKGVGKKNVYLLNLPEVKSAFKILDVPTVSARFGSDPFFWNWGMHTFANFLPTESLRDKKKVSKLVEVIDPIVRTIDGIAGECVSMRVRIIMHLFFFKK
ncbi:hypothetical protein HU200_054379 [Digitaria exilis]|uniref:Saccharopine dehydrogenase NADP binding domain-containing protein n=1 Tax=Digitaria exilis TaxID=1010633 RepID=A0A835AII6_9POAL|nr:hypothetical protein HU200_054379 [Digitaria exilis]